MEKIKAVKVGVLNLYGSRYSVLRFMEKNLDLPVKPLEASLLYGEKKATNLLVSKEFFLEKVHEGITMGETVNVTPHWISVAGDFAIEWLPAPMEVEVLVPAPGEVVNE